MLMALVDPIPPDKRMGHTIIDQAINGAAEDMTPNKAAEIVAAINAIESKCHGREQTESGFWS